MAGLFADRIPRASSEAEPIDASWRSRASNAGIDDFAVVSQQQRFDTSHR
jgi:hypothetical protein